MKLAKKKHKHIRIKNPLFWQILNETQAHAALVRALEALQQLERDIRMQKLLKEKQNGN